jgi:type IX secretion system PorP/SprF family membrane protein
MKKNSTGVSIIFLVYSVTISAQDLHFSQYYMAPLNQNPAMAGAVYDFEAILNYKSQWQSISTPYTTTAFTGDMRLGKKNRPRGFWAGGINFYSDKAGDSRMGLTQLNLTLAYHVRLDNHNTLGAGAQFGAAQRSIDYNGLKWGSQYNGNSFDSNLPTGEPGGVNAITYADASAGIVWAYSNADKDIEVTDNHNVKFNAGFSVMHVNEPLYSFYNASEYLYRRYVVQGNGLIPFANSNVALVPGFMYTRQGPAQEVYIGSLFRFMLRQDSKYTGYEKSTALSIGAFYRASDAIAMDMLLEYASYALGISYDLNVSPLYKASDWRGGYELSLRYVRPNPFRKGIREVPSFF